MADGPAGDAILSLDLCLGACVVALEVDGRGVIARREIPMDRGHQERIAPLVQEVTAEVGLSLTRLRRIGVTTARYAVRQIDPQRNRCRRR